jgi:hypothetical protein
MQVVRRILAPQAMLLVALAIITVHSCGLNTYSPLGQTERCQAGTGKVHLGLDRCSGL